MLISDAFSSEAIHETNNFKQLLTQVMFTSPIVAAYGSDCNGLT